MESGSILFAFGLTLFAGLSTGTGSVLAFPAKQTNTRFLAVSMGFSAGVMIYVSFAEIMTIIFRRGWPPSRPRSPNRASAWPSR
jgi:zinc transporter ZupT